MSNIKKKKKLTFSKLVGKVNFLERTFEEMHNFEKQKSTCIFGGNMFLALFSSTVFRPDIKGFYQGYLGNEVDYRDLMNVSPNILTKN